MPTIGSWIIDSGAKYHMTKSSYDFVSYNPCPSNKKISTADGTVITVAGWGDVVINLKFVLKNVFHVPKFSVNLVSVHKLTKDLNCIVTFSSTHCEFQDQGMGKMIGLARERNGLYYLESSGQNSTRNNFPFSFLSKSSLSNKNKIWLYHLRLGHPSFNVLKILFPDFFIRD